MTATSKISYFPVENVFTYTGTYQFHNWSNPTEVLDKLNLEDLIHLKRSFEKFLYDRLAFREGDLFGLSILVLNTQFVRRDQLFHQDQVRFVLTFRLGSTNFDESEVDEVEKFFAELFSPSSDTPFSVHITKSVESDAGGCNRTLWFRFE